MHNQQLVDYIKAQLQRGVSREEITKILSDHGWSETHVRYAFAVIDDNKAADALPQPQMGEVKLGLPGVGDLFSKAWQIFKSRFGTLFLVTLSYILASFLIQLFDNGNTPVLSFLLSLLLFFVNILNGAALLFVIAGYREKVGFKEAYSRALKKFWPFLWLSILMGVIIGAGFLLFIIPGIILSIWFSLAVWVFATEDARGMKALLKSKEYVRGIFGKVLGRLSVIALIPLLLYFLIISAYFAFASILFLYPLIALGLFFGLSLMIAFIYTPFAMAYAFALYEDVRVLDKGSVQYSKNIGKKFLYVFLGIAGLLIFVGIFAFILTMLSPTSNLAKGRDTQRISDLATLKTAIGIYSTTVDNPCKTSGTYDSMYGSTKVDGTGWLPIDFTKIVGGSVIGELPKDPTNNFNYKYIYSCDEATGRYELNAVLEGEYKNRATADGGNNPNVYEVGTNLSLLR